MTAGKYGRCRTGASVWFGLDLPSGQGKLWHQQGLAFEKSYLLGRSCTVKQMHMKSSF